MSISLKTLKETYHDLFKPRLHLNLLTRKILLFSDYLVNDILNFIADLSYQIDVVQFFVRYEYKHGSSGFSEFRVYNHAPILYVMHKLIDGRYVFNRTIQCFNHDQLLYESFYSHLIHEQLNQVTQDEIDKTYENLIKYKNKYNYSFGEIGCNLNDPDIHFKII